MVNCTVADNPGIAVSLSSANAVLTNNIIVGSSTDVSASNVTDGGYNLVGSASSGAVYRGYFCGIFQTGQS